MDEDPIVGDTMQFLFEDVTARIVNVILSFHAMNERTIRFLETGTLPPELDEPVDSPSVTP